MKFERSSEISIGSITQLIAEASDANATGIPVVDGMSGNVNFTHGNLKPLATVGERSVCKDNSNETFAGVPDGLGAYLSDDKTVSYHILITYVAF